MNQDLGEMMGPYSRKEGPEEMASRWTSGVIRLTGNFSWQL